jgi:hypothetical protein
MASSRPALLIHSECDYAVVDVSTDSTTVVNGPCIYFGAAVTTVLSAHALPIQDGSTAVDSFAASSAVGTVHSWPGIRCNTSLVVDPNDAATGSITVFYRLMNI